MEIKATDLRIGNIVRHKNGTKLYISATILFQGGIDEYLKPMPLNGTHLIQSGFIKNEFGVFVMDNKIIGFIEIDIKNKTFSIGGSDSVTSGQQYCGRINYVHQLQNLYFALTGEELILKN